MKALLAIAAGGTEALQLRDIAKPELPTSHHIRVKLAAAGVNPVDTKLRAKPAYHPDKLPAILGCDGAGIVEAIGEMVTRFKIGDAVYFCNGGIGDEPGNYAEYTTLHEDFCAKAPTNLDLPTCAAIPLVWITVWEALVDRVNLQAGQTILIHAAAGGVGHLAVQLARLLGARIAVTVSDERKAGIAKQYGADKIINYKTQDFVQESLSWTHGKGVDVVFDSVGSETYLRSFNATRLCGKVVSIVGTPLAAADIQTARLRNLSLCYELMLMPQVMQLHDERVRQRKILEHATELVEANKLEVLVSHALPISQAAEAHRLIEVGGIVGKIILTMS
jgi:NADPH2:quinone reductase